MYKSAGAAITKYHCLGGQWHKQQTFISHNSGDWEVKIEVPANSMSGESSFSWLADSHFLTVSSYDRERKISSLFLFL